MIKGCKNPPKCRTNSGLIRYIKKLGVSSKTADAMKRVNRIRHIPEEYHDPRAHAYWDTAQSIGHDVTISQPSLVGKMIDYLDIQPMNNVLELGTGSAYNAAILSQLLPYGHLTTVERVIPLGQRAKQLLKRKNVTVIIGDALKVKYKHPFDRVIVTAEFLSKEAVMKMLEKIAGDFSVSVFPFQGELIRVTKCSGKIVNTENLLQVRFVPVLQGTKT